jgi:hypothetical protein
MATSFDVLLLAKASTRYGVENRWFIAGSSPKRMAARLLFQELCKEFPTERVVLLLVASIWNEDTQRFHDHVLDSRSIAPLIDRKRAEKLTPQTRELIKQAIIERPLAPLRPPPAPRGGGGLGWWIAACGVVGAVVLTVLLRS